VNNVRLCAALLLCGAFGQRASAQTLIGTEGPYSWIATLEPCPSQVLITVSVYSGVPGHPGLTNGTTR
jgi:hypothetical protein